MGRMFEEILTNRDILIYLLQDLSFVINLKKSVLKLSHQIEIFRPKNRYPHHELGTNIGKDGKGNF